MNIYYPVKNPINPNNLFGANPDEYKPLGQIGHPGNDFESPTGTKVYAPCDGKAFYTSDSLGGDGIYIHIVDSNGDNYNIILWHMPVATGSVIPGVSTAAQYPFQIPTDRSIVEVKAGQFLGYTDNSGYKKESTGPHLHLGVQPTDVNWVALYPNNGYLGCVDPHPYYNGMFAEDINALNSLLPEIATIAPEVAASSLTIQEKLGFFKTVAQFLSKLIFKQ